ncbi:class A beta-lactamase, subclass A2 [Dyadobacter flavalbus]|uniref:Beta-lactamase n=1 Tax=Dyadobacter flavalbus TaxID=2579942 RepID=A0A5M8QGE7_9BACT|nr:class A beta-lactamase, subclass A2 [Dyadobacter flavalbus]KAA6433990.1 class A beta-lactamase, subclass A2 [Dyadobacter flavalbus]
MKKHVFRILLASILTGFVFLPENSVAQKDELKAKIDSISKLVQGTVGIGIMDLKSGETLYLNEKHQFPMQSVFKFPLGMAVLDQVDKGKLSLDQKIHVKKEDLNPDTWSPLQKKFPEGNLDLSLRELLTYTVSLSDNNTCDILFRLVGGPRNVNKYMQSIGVKGINIVATEAEMAKNWDVQFTNWCRPPAMIQLLDVFHQGKKLSKSSTEFLMKIMTETPTGLNRIKGLLPENTKVAHKTGSSGTNDKGISAAFNDAGIVTMPNGKSIAIVAFVSNTPADEKTRDMVIAQISRAAWDYYSR